MILLVAFIATFGFLVGFTPPAEDSDIGIDISGPVVVGSVFYYIVKVETGNNINPGILFNGTAGTGTIVPINSSTVQIILAADESLTLTITISEISQDIALVGTADYKIIETGENNGIEIDQDKDGTEIDEDESEIDDSSC